MNAFDVIIIGFGKGGKTLAAEFAKRGQKVAIIERSDKMYGGTCINIGCIPTKTLVHQAKMASALKDATFEERSEFYRNAVSVKESVTSALRDKNYHNLADNPNVTVYTGIGSFVSADVVAVRTATEEIRLTSKQIIINTGAETVIPPIEGVAGNPFVYTSTSIMELADLPRRLVIIGGGPAGLAAAVAARKSGVQDILILERDSELGGILNQCIHNGFGLHTFKEELTGPEYAARFVAQVRELGIEYKLNTMVLDLAADKTVTAMNKTDGLFQLHPKAVILAMGCRERPRGALNIPGYRPAGIFTAGTAQRLVNMEGCLPGRRVVILGSGDIGLIMARRMTLEGAKVLCVAELMPYSGGLKRNIVQCLDDFGIPLKLSHTVVDIQGKERVTGITLARVENGKPVPGTEEHYDCDTLLLSCGLLPENELSRAAGVALNPVTGGPAVNESLETNLPGVFAAGNVLHVHDLVDYVSEEAAAAGEHAAAYIAGGGAAAGRTLPVRCENGVRYTVPTTIRPDCAGDTVTLRFRVGGVYKNKKIAVYRGTDCIYSRKRPVLAPGEMETVRLKAELLRGPGDAVTVTLEEG